jgi:hypothetical protein
MTDAQAPITPAPSGTHASTCARQRHNKPTQEIPLWEVLEEEYEAVHGKLPTEYVNKRNQELKKISAEPTAKGWDRIRRAEAENKTIVPRLYEQIHALRDKRSALCISGGGIRSATFGLGVLQGLACCDLLKQFTYLSTVSGGGYIGSWLSAWIWREPVDRQTAVGEVSNALAQRGMLASLNPEPSSVTYLRKYSNYLTPRLGFLSGDTWSLVATYLRNLTLNWLILLPLLAIPLMIPRFVVRTVYWASIGGTMPVALTLTLLILGVILQAYAIAFLDRNRPSIRRATNRDRSWEDGQSAFVWTCWLPLMASVSLLTLAWVGLYLYWPIGHDLWLSSFGKWFGWAEPSLDSPLGFVLFQVGVSLLAAVMNLVLSPRIRATIFKSWGISKYASQLLLTLACASLGGILLWLVASSRWLDPDQHLFFYSSTAFPLYLIAFVLAGGLLHGVMAALNKSHDDLEWSARAAGWILAAAVVWAAFALLIIFGPSLLLKHWPSVGNILKWVLVAIGGLSGPVVAKLGASAKTPASREEAAKMGVPNVKSALVRQLALSIAAPVFVIFLAVMLSLASDWLFTRDGFFKDLGGRLLPGSRSEDAYLRALYSLQFWPPKAVWYRALLPSLLGWTLIFFAISLVASILINVNIFSLHGVYRNRLIRAYLGASHKNRDTSPTFTPFTGFDPTDDIALHELRKGSSPNGAPLAPLFHVINMALNVVSGENLAWQQRKAESFTATSLHCGSNRLGYRDSEDYGGGLDHLHAKNKPISLGSAMTISGAATNPNMGYHSSPVIGFLLTLFNVRLGSWLGNPGPAGDRCWPSTYGKSAPQIASRPLVEEAFGLTDDKNPYVNLSDGGHFENLGLYEMVRRRCHYIVVSDAGQDADGAFEDLGNAIRKIFIDMGVEIDFDGKIPILPRKSPPSPESRGGYCAAATIRYSKVDRNADDTPAPDGHLIYIKPAFYENEPTDVFNYGKLSETFPHETTVDQFFSESQFESYRRLGEYIISQIYPDGSSGWLCPLVSGPRSTLGLLTIESVKPAAGPAAGGPTITIRGGRFVNGISITFGGQPANDLKVIDETTITVRCPAGTSGTSVDIKVLPPQQAPGTQRSSVLKGGYRYE